MLDLPRVTAYLSREAFDGLLALFGQKDVIHLGYACHLFFCSRQLKQGLRYVGVGRGDVLALVPLGDVEMGLEALAQYRLNRQISLEGLQVGLAAGQENELDRVFKVIRLDELGFVLQR